MPTCPTGAIEGEKAYKILAGGKLGRHPKLAECVGVEKNLETAVKKMKDILSLYIEKSDPLERLGEFMERS